MLAAILALLKFLPEVIDIGKTLAVLISQGIDEANIRKSLKAVDKAFLIKTPKDRAKELNDVFRKG